MSLDYNLKNIPLAIRSNIEPTDTMDAKRGDRTQASVTRALIFATMHIGMNEITATNYQEFYLRIKFYERLFEPLLSFNSEELQDARITIQDVKDHIGLSTNATNETLKKWHNRMLDTWIDEQKRYSKYDAEKEPLWRRLKHWLENKFPDTKQEWSEDKEA